MAEHRIQLRKAWVEHREGSEAQRIDLPIASLPDRPLRLSRRFGRPRIGPEGESLWLCLSNVQGLRVVRLNGRVVIEVDVGTRDVEIPLPTDLPDRNLLELDVDAEAGATLPDWGRIALVVRS